MNQFTFNCNLKKLIFYIKVQHFPLAPCFALNNFFKSSQREMEIFLGNILRFLFEDIFLTFIMIPIMNFKLFNILNKRIKKCKSLKCRFQKTICLDQGVQCSIYCTRYT